MSQDGRFTVFLSAEDDLSADDDDRFINVFRRDNLTGDTVLVSRADGAAGAAADGTSGSTGGGLAISPGAPFGAPSISADGNRIAFSERRNEPRSPMTPTHCPTCSSGTSRPAARCSRAATARAGIPFPSGDPAISGDGLKVAFVSRFAGDPLDGNNVTDVYLRDLGAGTTTLVSRKGAAGPVGQRRLRLAGDRCRRQPHRVRHRRRRLLGAARREHERRMCGSATPPPGSVSPVSVTPAGNATADDGSVTPAISADGNRIAFSSIATNLVPGVDVNGGILDVFVRDMAAASTSLVSRTTGANGISGNRISERAAMDASGTRIVFETFASDLVPGDVNGATDVLLRDTSALTTELVSRGDGPPARRPACRARCRASRATATAWRSRPSPTTWCRCPRAPTTRAWSRGRCAATARSGRCRRRRADRRRDRPRPPTPRARSSRT